MTWSWNVSLSLLTNCLSFVIFFQACSTTAKDILPQLKSSLTLPSTIVPSCLWIERIKSKLRAEYETEGRDTGCDVINLQNHGRKKNFAPRLEDSTIFELLKFCEALEKFFGKRFFVEIAWKIFVKTLFIFGDRVKNFCEDLFFFFFWRALAHVSLVLGLGLEHSCPWPRECLSSERLSLALASDFFCVLGLGLEPCVLDSTSDSYPTGIVGFMAWRNFGEAWTWNAYWMMRNIHLGFFICFFT